MNERHLDPDQLCSFLAVADTLHFTSAARTRGISQSTISQHVSRLEEHLGTRLLLRSTKQVALSPAGQRLVSLARDLLRAHETILSAFDDVKLRGTLRLGITEDIVLTRFPELLGRFRARHPEVAVTLQVNLSFHLRAALEAGEIDMFFGMRPIGETHGRLLWREQLLWLGGGQQSGWRHDGPIPLVTFPDGSVTRRLAIEALNQANKPWRLAFVSENLSGLLAAVRAGYGITAQPAFLADENLSPLPQDATLQPLPEVEFISATRLSDPHGPSAALHALIAEYIELLDSRAQTRPIPA